MNIQGQSLILILPLPLQWAPDGEGMMAHCRSYRRQDQQIGGGMMHHWEMVQDVERPRGP